MSRVDIKLVIVIIEGYCTIMGVAHKMDARAGSWVFLFAAALCVVPEAASVLGKTRRTHHRVSY